MLYPFEFSKCLLSGMTVDAVDKGVNGCIVKTITSGAIAQDGRIQVTTFILPFPEIPEIHLN